MLLEVVGSLSQEPCVPCGRNRKKQNRASSMGRCRYYVIVHAHPYVPNYERFCSEVLAVTPMARQGSWATSFLKSKTLDCRIRRCKSENESSSKHRADGSQTEASLLGLMWCDARPQKTTTVIMTSQIHIATDKNKAIPEHHPHLHHLHHPNDETIQTWQTPSNSAQDRRSPCKPRNM